mmetsp:Transcript_64491/g.153989  ORF Transcript_64491/g.153989 Transcript_64491/m.153989 type:complete len:208 (+) Transcript_64491:4728-5351(+)
MRCNAGTQELQAERPWKFHPGEPKAFSAPISHALPCIHRIPCGQTRGIVVGHDAEILHKYVQHLQLAIQGARRLSRCELLDGIVAHLDYWLWQLRRVQLTVQHISLLRGDRSTVTEVLCKLSQTCTGCVVHTGARRVVEHVQKLQQLLNNKLIQQCHVGRSGHDCLQHLQLHLVISICCLFLHQVDDYGNSLILENPTMYQALQAGQ